MRLNRHERPRFPRETHAETHVVGAPPVSVTPPSSHAASFWLTRWIYQSPPAGFALGLLSVMLLKTGIWVMPNLDVSQAIAKDPFASANHIYLVTNWLHLFLAWLAGAAHHAWAFMAFHLAFSLGFVATFYLWARHELTDPQARTSLVMFACLPVSGTSFYWLGMDSVTLFLLMLALTTQRHPLAALLVGLTLGMQHFEQAIVALFGLGLYLAFEARNHSYHRSRLPWLGCLAIGAIVGKGTAIAVLHGSDIVVVGDRLAFLREHWPVMMKALAANLHSVLWTLLAAGWFAAIYTLRFGRQMLSFWLAFVPLLAVLLLVEDQTRVFAIVSFPLLAFAWLFNPGFLERFSPRLVTALLAVWLVVPWYWSWRGVAYGSVLPYDLAVISHALWQWPTIPTNAYLWPF